MNAPMPPSLRQHFRPQPPEHAIPCPVPTCKAKPSSPCRTPRGRTLAAGSHPSRCDAWLITQQAA